MIGEVLTRRGVVGLIAGAFATGGRLPSAAESRTQISQAPNAYGVDDPRWEVWQDQQGKRDARFAFRIGGCEPHIACMRSWSHDTKMRVQMREDNRARSFFARLRKQLGI